MIILNVNGEQMQAEIGYAHPVALRARGPADDMACHGRRPAA